MSYTPDPNNPLTPNDSTPIGRAHAEIRALKQKISTTLQEVSTALSTNQNTVDTKIATALANLNTTLNNFVTSFTPALEHVSAKGNVHNLTKTILGIDEIPNVFYPEYTFLQETSFEEGVISASGFKDFYTTLQTALNDIRNWQTELLPKIFSIGSLYITKQNVNPNTILGFGSWAKLDDVYIKSTVGASSPNGTVLFSHNKKITLAQLPNHGHSPVAADINLNAVVTNVTREAQQVDGAGSIGGNPTITKDLNITRGMGNVSVSINETRVGNGEDFNVQPRTKEYYIWERVG